MLRRFLLITTIIKVQEDYRRPNFQEYDDGCFHLDLSFCTILYYFKLKY